MLYIMIAFTIPVAVGIISKDDFQYFAKGALAGIMTVPVGLIVGGVMMKVELIDMVYNLIPVLIFTVIITVGLIKVPDMIIKAFNILGKAIIKISTFGLIISIIDFIFQVNIIPGMFPLEKSALIVFQIAIILSGAYPMLYYIIYIVR